MANVHCMETLAPSHWILTKSGLWPMRTLSSLAILKIIFNILIDAAVFTIIVHNIANAVNYNNIKLLNWMTCIIIPITSYIAKSATMLLNKRYFFTIIDDLNSSTFNLHSQELNKHITFIKRISVMIIKYFAFAQTIFALVFNILPFVMDIQMMVPPSFETGNFDVMYKTAHLFAAIYLGINSTALDVLYMVLMALCSAQINILEEQLSNMLSRHEKIDSETIDLVEDHMLKRFIILHEAINRFVKKLDALLSLPLFVQYASGCFMICNSILQLTLLSERDTTNIIGLCGYSAIVFAQMSVYHWLGNEITFKSNKIAEACYLSNWYKLDLDNQKTIILLMERAKRPLAVTLYKLVVVSLASLGVVVRWSYSIFAIIKAGYS